MLNTADLQRLLPDLHLPLLIAGIVLAVQLTRILGRILDRLVDRVLPPVASGPRQPGPGEK